MRLFTRRRLGDQWVAVHARSALEIALWDSSASRRPIGLASHRPVRDGAGVRVDRLLGGRSGRRTTSSCWQPLLERGVRQGEAAGRPRMGGRSVTLAEVRGALGRRRTIMVDGSEIFTLPTALEVAHRLHESGRASGSKSRCRRATGRRSKSSLAVAGADRVRRASVRSPTTRSTPCAASQLSVLQPDASTCGGIGELRRMAQAAVPFGVRVVPHVCAGPVSLAANLHLAATVPAIRMIEYPPSAGRRRGTFGRDATSRPGDDRRRRVDGADAARASAWTSTRPPPTHIPTDHRGAPCPPATVGGACPTDSSATVDRTLIHGRRHMTSHRHSDFRGPIGPRMSEFSDEYMATSRRTSTRISPTSPTASSACCGRCDR